MRHGDHIRLRVHALVCAATVLVVAALAGSASARPTYFDTLRNKYGIGDGDNLDACGVCHFLWEGTGARNPYGTAVEQQLYVGKSIDQSLTDVEGADSDADGFLNLDEIVNFMTLPGYSCENFEQAIGAPTGHDTYIEPMVASCLEPLDIRVSVESIAISESVGDVTVEDITVFNNGTDFALTINSFALVDGSNPDLTVMGPGAPFSIPVGGNAILQLVFTPSAPAFINDILRIDSDDPDENPVDIDVTAIAINDPVAPAALRRSCLAAVDKAYRGYTKTHLRAWTDCYTDEVSGVACDTGARDLRIAKAANRLRDRVGGSKDRLCAPLGLSPSLLDMAATCASPCESISLNTLAKYADCLVCLEETAMEDTLRAVIGTAPPDLPPNTAATPAAALCQRRLAKAMNKAVRSVQRIVGECEVEGITAGSPPDCAADTAAQIADVQARVDGKPAKCDDTSGLDGCLFQMTPAPTCLGDESLAVGSRLVDALLSPDD